MIILGTIAYLIMGIVLSLKWEPKKHKSDETIVVVIAHVIVIILWPFVWELYS